MAYIYNIMAELCSIVIRSCPDESIFVKYGCLSLNRKKEMLWDISQNISQLFETAADSEDQMPVVRQLKENDLNDSFYSELEVYISALQSR